MVFSVSRRCAAVAAVTDGRHSSSNSKVSSGVGGGSSSSTGQAAADRSNERLASLVAGLVCERIAGAVVVVVTSTWRAPLAQRKEGMCHF